MISRDTQTDILFRTNDLNGATAEVILKTGTRLKIKDVIECTPENMDSNLNEFIDSEKYRQYRTIIIVGAGFSRIVADKLDEIVLNEGVNVIYRDHHKDSLDLSKYMWGRILIWDRNGNEISSSKNLFREYVSKEHSKYIRLSILSDLVNACVTDSKPEEDLEGAQTIAQLFEQAGSATKFAESMTEKILTNDAFFNESDILEAIEAERKAEEEREAELALLKSKRKRVDRGI